MTIIILAEKGRVSKISPVLRAFLVGCVQGEMGFGVDLMGSCDVASESKVIEG